MRLYFCPASLPGGNKLYNSLVVTKNFYGVSVLRFERDRSDTVLKEKIP